MLHLSLQFLPVQTEHKGDGSFTFDRVTSILYLAQCGTYYYESSNDTIIIIPTAHIHRTSHNVFRKFMKMWNLMTLVQNVLKCASVCT